MAIPVRVSIKVPSRSKIAAWYLDILSALYFLYGLFHVCDEVIVPFDV